MIILLFSRWRLEASGWIAFFRNQIRTVGAMENCDRRFTRPENANTQQTGKRSGRALG